MRNLFHKGATKKYIVVTVEYETALTATEQRRTTVPISLNLAPTAVLASPTWHQSMATADKFGSGQVQLVR